MRIFRLGQVRSHGLGELRTEQLFHFDLRAFFDGWRPELGSTTACASAMSDSRHSSFGFFPPSRFLDVFESNKMPFAAISLHFNFPTQFGECHFAIRRVLVESSLTLTPTLIQIHDAEQNRTGFDEAADNRQPYRVSLSLTKTLQPYP